MTKAYGKLGVIRNDLQMKWHLFESWRISKSLKLERWGKAIKIKKMAWKYEEQDNFWKEQALHYSWGYNEVVQYG